MFEAFADPASSVLSLDDDFVFGFAAGGTVGRMTAGGNVVWGYSTELDFDYALRGISGLTLAPDGSILVAAVFDDLELPSGSHLWVGALSPDGELQWHELLGAAHSGHGSTTGEWMTADVLAHPEGGYVVSWHDSQAEGAEPRLMLARVRGAVEWSTARPLAPDSDVAYAWADGAADLLPDGSILQLTADAGYLRLVRTSADGELVSDVVLADRPAWPKDLRVLPDGGVLVLANHDRRATLLEVDPEGTVVYEHDHGDNEPFLGAMEWDPVHEVLYLGGVQLDAADHERPWTLVVDRNGDELSSHVDYDSDDGVARDAAALPGGGLAVTRMGPRVLVEAVRPCSEG